MSYKRSIWRRSLCVIYYILHPKVLQEKMFPILQTTFRRFQTWAVFKNFPAWSIKWTLRFTLGDAVTPNQKLSQQTCITCHKIISKLTQLLDRMYIFLHFSFNTSLLKSSKTYYSDSKLLSPVCAVITSVVSNFNSRFAFETSVLGQTFHCFKCNSLKY